ncbi:uncharacterized protein LOC144446265 [Glandiceps talaboti]
MAYKRSMYKPALVENVGLKENRRSVAQGRLSTNPTLPDSLTVYASPNLPSVNYTDAGDTSITISHGPVDVQSFSPRQSLGEYDKSRAVWSDDPAASPRSKLPTSSYIDPTSVSEITRSPSRPKPEKLLELSDSDDEISLKRKSLIKHVTHTSPTSVQLVDASGGRLDMNTSEVGIRTDIMQSPVKIVCHSPAVVESDLRNTGYTQQNAKVQMDTIQSFSVLGDEDFTEVTHKDVRREKQPLVVRQNITTGTKPEIIRKRVLREATSDNITVDGIAKLPGDLRESLPLHRYDNISACSSVSDSMEEKREAAKKKKKSSKGKVIPSRYMQSLQTTLPSKHNVTLAGRSVDTTLKTKAQTTKKTGPKRGNITNSKAFGDFGITPVPAYHGARTNKKRIVTSTPATSMIGTPGFPGNESYLAHLPTGRTSTGTRRQQTAPGVSDSTIAEMTTALDMEMRKVTEDQENTASSQLYWLWNENDKFHQRKAELELEVAQLVHSNILDEQLQQQRSGLGPVVAGLDQLKQEHNTLAKAVDTTRHHVPTHGIYMPPNERDYLEQMKSELGETEQLLAEITALTREEQPRVAEFAKSMEILSDATQNERQEMDILHEVLQAFSSLTTHEVSLKMIQMQRVQGDN